MENIRRLSVHDYEQFLELITMFRKTNFTKNQYIEVLGRIERYGEVWVYEVEQKLLGSITLMVEDKFIFDITRVVHIEDVIVNENYRKQGIGKKLISKAKIRAKELGCYKISLVCSNENKTFYEKCGMGQRGVHMSSLLE